MSGRIITFYSYKGGTGRTMALANAAVILSRDRHAKVLAIDWDLEAPGLHRFFERDGDDATLQPGLIELFATAHEELGPAPETISRETFWRDLPIEQHLCRTAVPSLSLMRAGRLDADYADRVNTFDWQALYEAAPWVFQAFVQTLGERYDYVLIDSRTGVTDAGGICTMLLPERLVVVFTPNRQSLTGVVELVRRATSYRRRSDDLRPLTVFPLASRVELSEEDLRRRWRGGGDAGPSGNGLPGEDAREGYQPTFEHLFQEVYDLPACDLERYFDEVQVQHAPRFAYGEQIAVLDESASDRLSLSRSYVGFTRALVDTAAPWELKPSAPEPTAEAPERREAVLEEVDEMIESSTWQAHRLRRIELSTRLLQGTFGLLGVMITIALAASYGSSPSDWVPYLAGGAAIVGLLELFLRTWAPPAVRIAIAGGAAALTRERRLYQAYAGPYAEADAPVARLAERSDEIVAEVERAAPGVSIGDLRPPTPTRAPAPRSRA
jgi:cellulose biosynthesis protein BcsQ